MDQKIKCTISDDGQHVEPCHMLDAQTEYGNPQPRKRGIFAWALHNFTTGKPSRTFFGVVSSESPKGWVFNFCPFCGEKIDSPCVTKDDAA